MLVSIDGQPVRGLMNLHERVSAAQNDKRPITLVLKRMSRERDRAYDYMKRTVAIENLEFVGPTPNKRAARLFKP